VVPDTGRNVYAAFMGDADRRLESCCVLRLLGGGDTHHLHVWEARSVEEIRVQRRHESAIFVAEYHHEAIDAVCRKHVKVTGPVTLIVEALFEVSALHGVCGDAPLG
jgi:hypothetical protein